LDRSDDERETHAKNWDEQDKQRPQARLNRSHGPESGHDEEQDAHGKRLDPKTDLAWPVTRTNASEIESCPGGNGDRNCSDADEDQRRYRIHFYWLTQVRITREDV
jgi:hypothetical protein